MKSDNNTLQNHLDEMVEKGVNCFDPVRFSYIESLTRRAARMPKAVRQQLEQRAADALADYEICFERAQKEAKNLIGHMASAYPETIEPLQRLYSAKDFEGIKRLSRKRRRAGLRTPLSLLIEQISGENRLAFQKTASFEELLHQREDEMRPPLLGNEASDLKSYQLFKETWARHYSDKLVSDAVRNLPETPGPLNSQMLITRSLIIMRDLSPDYLKRFISYADTLLWLEDATGKLISHEDSKR